MLHLPCIQLPSISGVFSQVPANPCDTDATQDDRAKNAEWRRLSSYIPMNRLITSVITEVASEPNFTAPLPAAFAFRAIHSRVRLPMSEGSSAAMSA